jgi:hypothetical protein
MSAVTTATTIKTEPVVYFANPQSLPVGSSTRLSIRDLLAGILGNLSPSSKILRGKASFTVDGGALDYQSRRKLQLHWKSIF